MSINYIIVILNVIMRFSFMALGRCMHFKNKSQKYKFIMNSVFVATFFQTGLVCMVAFWDLRWDWINSSFFKKFFGGIYPDFNADWFNDAGVWLIVTFKA